jgi:hypothetical protein
MGASHRIALAVWVLTLAALVLIGFGVYLALHGLAWQHAFRDGELSRFLVISDPNQLIAGTVITVLGIAALLSVRLLVRAVPRSAAEAHQAAAADGPNGRPAR